MMKSHFWDSMWLTVGLSGARADVGLALYPLRVHSSEVLAGSQLLTQVFRRKHSKSQ
jgi:hypothetical protein